MSSLLAATAAVPPSPHPHPRARQAGVLTGVLPPGPFDAITDVARVLVGQVTVVAGDGLRAGVTVTIRHPGNVFREKAPAAVFVGNGFGKLTGTTQVAELGTLETPVELTGTLSTWRSADALAAWVLAQPGNADVVSASPVVGECNDGYLSDIRKRPEDAHGYDDGSRLHRFGPHARRAGGAAGTRPAVRRGDHAPQTSLTDSEVHAPDHGGSANARVAWRARGRSAGRGRFQRLLAQRAQSG